MSSICFVFDSMDEKIQRQFQYTIYNFRAALKIQRYFMVPTQHERSLYLVWEPTVYHTPI